MCCLRQSKQHIYMKSNYKFILMTMVLLTSRLAVGQDTGPGGPIGNGGRTENRPFVGVGVSIPLHKLFGPKKAKTLSVEDKWRLMELPDSQAGNGSQPVLELSVKTESVLQPMQGMAAKPDSGGVMQDDGSGSTTNDETVDLPEVTVTPSGRAPIILPEVTVTAAAPGSGSPAMTVGTWPGPAMVPPPPGVGGPGGDNGVDETDADGNPLEKPCKGQLLRARQAYEGQIYAAGAVFITAMAGCGITAFSLSGSTAVANAWLVAIPGVGSVTLGSLVAGTAIVVGAVCATTAALVVRSAILSAASTLDMAQLQIGPCP